MYVHRTAALPPKSLGAILRAAHDEAEAGRGGDARPYDGDPALDGITVSVRVLSVDDWHAFHLAQAEALENKPDNPSVAEMMRLSAKMRPASIDLVRAALIELSGLEDAQGAYVLTPDDPDLVGILDRGGLLNPLVAAISHLQGLSETERGNCGALPS